jgi:hypothetical protein
VYECLVRLLQKKSALNASLLASFPFLSVCVVCGQNSINFRQYTSYHAKPQHFYATQITLIYIIPCKPPAFPCSTHHTMHILESMTYQPFLVFYHRQARRIVCEQVLAHFWQRVPLDAKSLVPPSKEHVHEHHPVRIYFQNILRHFCSPIRSIPMQAAGSWWIAGRQGLSPYHLIAQGSICMHNFTSTPTVSLTPLSPAHMCQRSSSILHMYNKTRVLMWILPSLIPHVPSSWHAAVLTARPPPASRWQKKFLKT